MTTIVIGAGIGGLSAAIALAAQGEAVTVIERQEAAGGKLRPIMIGGQPYDGCATVMTMGWVFEELFALAKADFSALLPMQGLPVYGRHYWSGGVCLDLHADKKATKDAISGFAGSKSANQHAAFMAEAAAIYENLKAPFLQSQRPTPIKLAASMSLSRLLRVNPFENLSSALKRHFDDRRLVQLFGRYATYCGSSPFMAPATLMLIAQVEAEGVWRIQRGMYQLAAVMQQFAERLGVEFHFGSEVVQIGFSGSTVSGVRNNEGLWISCDSLILNGDPQALAAGVFGAVGQHNIQAISAKDRSLSAITWIGPMASQGAALNHHTVFFSDDYAAEFKQLQHGLPSDPTVYVCDQGETRKQVLINAPANPALDPSHADALMRQRLQSCGLELQLSSPLLTRHTPKEFSELYRETQGALYGRALNSWNATFLRPQARTRIPGLYLAGGATHPGPGVPMAALSGMRAAEALLQDRASMNPFRKTAIAGGISMA